MIQELLGGVVEESRKISIPGGFLLHPSSSSPTTSLSSQSQSPASSSPTTAALAEPQQNLRCPRCDSSNTKFCYYNNYNLTQPRHFCKTCRRYWTKGGALRNVPIGGGCRKAKSLPSIASAATAIGNKSTSKTKPSADLLIGSDLAGGHDGHDLPLSPVLWSSPSASHLMAFLRATSVHNTKANPNSSGFSNFNPQSVAEPALMVNNIHGLSSDPLVHDHTSAWRNSRNCSYQQPQPQSQPLHHSNNILLGHDMPSLGFQDLYQRLKLSSTTEHYHINEQLQTVMPSFGSLDPSSCSYATSSAAPVSMDSCSTYTVMEPSPLSVGELGYWIPSQALPWADLSTAANGAFH